ncbi:pyridoxal-dependent decarboxylase [Caballeronia sp. LZ043]|uniref:pyridoxal phosphate-dependent decarboxylase family protein n=1 Tax=Caballeronia sp. LZ043 TaxID=3038569 RepID=UPI00285E1E2E|nr:pyridoxal-dependent decarboxylase [Caballeronia sp. LZ043]MDR5824867.1 pyridoxal-dependent decarboxylase [Caballeronia sp. LZ043]
MNPESHDPLARWRHLWPHRDNQTVFRETLGRLFDDYCRWHEHWQGPLSERPPADNRPLLRAIELLDDLSRRLQADSTPWPAPQYLAHMNADPLLPAGLAYFAAMLYNPNNVTPEAAPVTTTLEHELSDDFCRLFGFDPQQGWAHLTSGGHAANYEAIWIARNLQRVPFALAEGNNPQDDARLCNLPPREIVARLSHALENAPPERLRARIDAIHDHPALRGGRILVASGRHYAWDKCADLLGLVLEPVEMDASMRIDIAALRERLFAHFKAAYPVVAVIATAGSSGEGSVDEIHRIVALRQECEDRFGVSFFLHVDAAFGGYYRTLLQPLIDEDACTAPHVSGVLKPEVVAALQALCHADTITVDPHKCAGVPYPAGCLAIRDRRFSWAISSPTRYFRPSSSRHMEHGPHTLEGARPGAAAAAVWMAHRLSGLHRSGLGALLAGNALTATQLHHALNAQPAFLLDGVANRFRSMFAPDLCILNFCIHPAEQVVLNARRIELLSERMIGNAQLPGSGDEKLPWFSRNRVSLRDIMPDAVRRETDETDDTTVVRCCVMKPVSHDAFAAFLRNSLDRLFARIGGRET